MARLDDAQRFESHVNRTDEHHLWTGSTNPHRGTGKLQVNGKQTTAHRRAWELAVGPLKTGEVVLRCPVAPLCVRVEHLRLVKPKAARGRSRATQSSAASTRVQVQVNGVRAHRRVRGDRGDLEATRVQLREELRHAAPTDRDATRWTLDDLIAHYLTYLEDQGRELRTRARYEGVAKLWISPAIGTKAARRVSADDIDRCFAHMRRAGQSASSMNQAKALLSGAFKWARRTGKAIHNPLLDFQMPKSRHVQREKLPPEADEISLILKTAWVQTPDIAPILTLAATTGARLGELVVPRASDVDWERSTLSITAAAGVDGSLKETKRPQHRREVPLDEGTLEVLRRQLENASARAVFFDIPTPDDPFLFSLEPDSSRPMMPGYVTKRLQVLKGHLGVEDKRPETIALEDEALRLRRCGTTTRPARRGPAPMNGSALSYDEVGSILHRSQVWARRACDAAERRESAGADRQFNLSFNGFRKFTSSELLDAGFNLNVVAQRQGHSPAILTKHYSKARLSARRKAAEHLGAVVHGSPVPIRN